MKKLFYAALFVIITGCLYGQTAPENRWLLGKWTGEYRSFNASYNLLGRIMPTDFSDYSIELTLNDNGIGTYK